METQRSGADVSQQQPRARSQNGARNQANSVRECRPATKEEVHELAEAAEDASIAVAKAELAQARVKLVGLNLRRACGAGLGVKLTPDGQWVTPPPHAPA